MSRPEELLKRLAGPDAVFREHQREAITDLVEDRARVLCVQRTGWGKSAVYFLATSLLRETGAGPALIVSPLLALMRNQIDAARKLGIRAHTINSTNRDAWAEVRQLLETDAVDLLLISPERLNNPQFRDTMLPLFAERVGLLVIDEAHCISDWGHDFRPDYRRIQDMLARLPEGVAVLCTTATANDRVVADISEQLQLGGAQLRTYRGELSRASLRLEVVELPAQADRLAWLATHLPTLPGSGIVYCLTVRDTINVSNWLDRKGIKVEAYSGKVESDERIRIEGMLLRNEVKCLVATSALGMGYDKPDLGFVVHFQGPGSPIAYYQQVGRAGRGLKEADAVLLRGTEDRDVQDFFIKSAFPPAEQVAQVMALFDAADGPLSTGALMNDINLGKGRMELMLKQLEVEGALNKVRGGWERSRREWVYDEERITAVTAARRAEQKAMEVYGTDGRCLMEALRTELDDPGAEPCGRCSVCTQPKFAGKLHRKLSLQAIAMLRERPIEIEPRKSTPTAVGGFKKILTPELIEPGRALSLLNDAGWGRLVVEGKFKDEHFSDELVEAAAELIKAWGPNPTPEWITAVPSLRHPELVPDFARRLAEAIGLPYSQAVGVAKQVPEQNTLENSRQQYLNVQGAFGVDRAACLPGPVLLVDDVVDSKWTLTEVGRQLRRGGVVAVVPFATAGTSFGA
jgi:ATP-dependent DNA helicase RecQ